MTDGERGPFFLIHQSGTGNIRKAGPACFLDLMIETLVSTNGTAYDSL
jgi:hypothetical protein